MYSFSRFLRLTLLGFVMFGILFSLVVWWADLPRPEEFHGAPWWHFTAISALYLAVLLVMDRWEARRNLRLDREGGERHGR